jgi:hypothetical protein
MDSFIYREFMLAPGDRAATSGGARPAGERGHRPPPAAYLPDPAQDVPPLAARQN